MRLRAQARKIHNRESKPQSLLLLLLLLLRLLLVVWQVPLMYDWGGAPDIPWGVPKAGGPPVSSQDSTGALWVGLPYGGWGPLQLQFVGKVRGVGDTPKEGPCEG